MESNNPFKKEWTFPTDHELKYKALYNASWVDTKREFNADYNGINVFLLDSDDTALCQDNEVEKYCYEVRLDALKTGAGPGGSRRGIWLDDRSFTADHRGGFVREYRNPLTPTALYECLKEPRFGTSSEVKHQFLTETPVSSGYAINADRRLVFMPNPDPVSILALAETAPFHQVAILREGVRKHLARETAIKVNCRQTFHFELVLHLPHLVFKKFPDNTQTSVGTGPIRNDADREWINLSILEDNTPDTKAPYGVYNSQFSLLICGSSNKHWIGYSFVDCDLDEEDMEEGDFTYHGMQDDPIAACAGGVIDANIPIQDPRAYFVVIFEVHIAKALKEAQNLVKMIECSVKNHRSRHSNSLSRSSTAEGELSVPSRKEAYDWNHEAMELIGHVLAVIREPIEVWDIFRSKDGDHQYFVDSTPESVSQTGKSLRAIAQSFDAFKNLRRKLDDLNTMCKNSAEALQSRLFVESNEAVQLQSRLIVESNKAVNHTGLSSELTFVVISPMALTIAYFSAPKSVLPFEPNPRAFFFSILIIMAIFKLIVIVFSGRPRQSRLWRSAAAGVKAAELDRMMPRNFSTVTEWSGNLVGSLTRRRSNLPPATIELHALEAIVIA